MSCKKKLFHIDIKAFVQPQYRYLCIPGLGLRSCPSLTRTSASVLSAFHMEMVKLNLLWVAKNLEKTKYGTWYSDVNVTPDLTKKQREEEKDLKNEAEKKHSLSDSDRYKNLHWVGVGARGER
jgi:hypothetical protein